jgi:uncharacterized protein YoxC
MAAVKSSPFYTYIEPVIKNPIARSVAPYVFSLVTMTIFLVFAVRPTLVTISNLQKDIQTQQEVLEALTTKARNLTSGKSNYEKLPQDTKKKIQDQMPLNANVVTLTASLQNAVPFGATISALQIDPVILYDSAPPSLVSELKEVKFSYNLDGTYQQLLTALENLNNTSRLFNITSIVLSRQATSSGTLSITGKGYFIK